MSLDFDSATLQMQHEEDEYDQEDYAREQELQQLLTDLPHDMLEDSGDHLSDYSAAEGHEQVHEPWDQEATRWNDHLITTDPPNDYGQDQNLYTEHFAYDQGNIPNDMLASVPFHPNEVEDKSVFEISGRVSENGSDDVYLGGNDYKAPSHYQQSSTCNLPHNFRAYPNGHQEEFSNQNNKLTNFADAKKELLKFGCSEATNNQSLEPYKVVYKPYQKNIQKSAPISPNAEVLDEMQQEFLNTGESSSENMQILQLQVLNKAKEKTLGELNHQLEERAQHIRYLSHQLAIMKDEKDGMYLSLQESQQLYQNSKEREIQLEGQLKVIETQIQTLTANEEQLIKQSKVAEVAMEGLQQQLLELRRSDALQRAREQHEAIVAALKQKLEEQTSSLQQKLDQRTVSLQEQTEICCHLKEHMKQLERTLEESKLEKNEIINRLSRSLEESQNQCANLLQAGLVKETTQLRLQLQQAQSAQTIGSEMNKALQEEIKELKEEIGLYESAAKHGVFLNDPGGNLNVEMTDSYVDLGIKQSSYWRTQLQSCTLNKGTDKGLSKDEIILELKVEMERLLNSNKTKRNRISRLQNDLEDCQKTIEELKSNVNKTRRNNMGSPSDTTECGSSDEVLRLKKENQVLQQEIESHNARIQELLETQEKQKKANQDLCSQMRQMIQDSDRDKQEALNRCERTYQQHYEDTKKKLLEEFADKQAAGREKLVQTYEENIAQLKMDIDELNKEMLVVKECYLAVCREKDEQEATLRAEFAQEQQRKEETLLEEKEDSLNKLRADLEEAYKNSMEVTKSQWQKEKEDDMKECLENEVAIAKIVWEKEQKEAQDQAFQEMEKEWQQRLAQALEDTKRAVVELRDHSSQTDESLRQAVAEAVEKQTALFREALREKEKSLREQETNCHERIATQVQLALTKARTLWLHELTDLEEFKSHLKVAREKWEQESEISIAKQICSAEEKWKKECENSDKAWERTKELEGKILSLKKELESKEEEIPALVKAELTNAWTQWHREKQEEILRLQEQSEKDYHSFLHEHRNKISEMLAKAKEDLANQKKELLNQKEAELKACLVRKQQEWAVQEARRLQNEIHQYEDRVLVQVELLLDDLHKDLVWCANHEHAWPAKWNMSSPPHPNLQFKEKLALCLQKAYRSSVSAFLEKAKKKWHEKYEGLGYTLKDSDDSCMPSGEGETGDKARPSMYDIGQQVELQRILRRRPSLQESERDTNSKCKEKNMSQEDICFEHYQQLERKEKECQDLKRKLDKACRHLQLAVKEHKTQSEQAQENEKIMETLMEENSAMKNKLDDLKSASVPPRSLSEGCASESCSSCDGKALEEMRSQYIKTVSKIKSDMLCYIHESKERAAEIIKAEVLRERQETARKMRKYYLICLQQLLIDDGKDEGAEKKIICAAGKIATMAKILETPVRSSSLNTAPQSAMSQNCEQPKEKQTHGEKIGETSGNSASQKLVSRCLQLQLEAENQSGLIPQTQVGRRLLKQRESPSVGATFVEAFAKDECPDGCLPRRVGSAAFLNPSPCVPQGTVSGSDSGTGTACETVRCLHERPRVAEGGSVQSAKQWKEAAPGTTQDFEVQETPVRDEGSPADWSLGRDSLHMDSSNGYKYPGQQGYPVVPLDTHAMFSMTTICSHTKDDASIFPQHPGGCSEKTLVVKSQSINCSEGHLAMDLGCRPFPDLDTLGPAGTRSGHAALCSTAGKNGKSLQPRRQIHNVAVSQLDSGFDSPHINFD